MPPVTHEPDDRCANVPPMSSSLRAIALLVTLAACRGASPEADAPPPATPATPTTPTTPAPPAPTASETKAPDEPIEPPPEVPAVPAVPAAVPGLPPPPRRAWGRLEVVEKGIARNLQAMLERRRSREDFTVHVDRAAYTTDGTRVVYCARESGADCTTCTITGRNGKSERISGGSGEDCDRSHEALRNHLHKIGYQNANRPWHYGRELAVVAAESTRPQGVKLGASLRDGGAEGFVRTVGACDRKPDESRCWPLAELDVVVPSPDGLELAAVIHFNEGEHMDEYRLERLSAATLAAAAYRAEGLAALVRDDFAAAAGLFVRETYADPTSWKGPYNLACAYARKRDPAAEAALREAARRDPAAVRKRARDDADLATVRGQPWFTDIVGAE
jgi:hypothetical protein